MKIFVIVPNQHGTLNVFFYTSFGNFLILMSWIRPGSASAFIIYGGAGSGSAYDQYGSTSLLYINKCLPVLLFLFSILSVRNCKFLVRSIHKFQVILILVISYQLKQNGRWYFHSNLFLELWGPYPYGLSILKCFHQGWNFVGFGFSQQFNLKKSDFPRIADSWNFSGLQIFGFGLRILAILLKVFL